MIVNPEDIAERFWSLAQKPSEEARREQLFLDDVIHKAHLEREIGARLEGVETALDVGAGTGRFSLWLAARGVRVTHVDVSAGMIERAHRDAVKAGLAERMAFRQGRLADIGGYAPGSSISSSAQTPRSRTSTRSMPRRSNRWCACGRRPLC